MNNDHVHPMFAGMFQPYLKVVPPVQKARSPFDEWQLTCYGNIIPEIPDTPDDELEDSAFELGNRLAEWIEYLTDKE
jgi:hypothetical protein